VNSVQRSGNVAECSVFLDWASRIWGTIRASAQDMYASFLGFAFVWERDSVLGVLLVCGAIYVKLLWHCRCAGSIALNLDVKSLS
jgi:hypothetical protein